MEKNYYNELSAMREAILDGIDKREVRSHCMHINRKTFDKCWGRAQHYVNVDEDWRKYVLHQVRLRFHDFKRLLADYYTEGYCATGLDEALEMDISTILQMLPKDVG